MGAWFFHGHSLDRFEKNYRGQIEYEVGGQDYLAWKAWRKSVKAAVAACAPAMSTMSTSHTDDAQAGVPLDTEFWSRVAASQAADDAEEAFDAEIPRQDQ